MPPDLKYRVLNAITQYSLSTPENVCTLNIKIDILFCVWFFCYSDSDIFFSYYAQKCSSECCPISNSVCGIVKETQLNILLSKVY